MSELYDLLEPMSQEETMNMLKELQRVDAFTFNQIKLNPQLSQEEIDLLIFEKIKAIQNSKNIISLFESKENINTYLKDIIKQIQKCKINTQSIKLSQEKEAELRESFINSLKVQREILKSKETEHFYLSNLVKYLNIKLLTSTNFPLKDYIERNEFIKSNIDKASYLLSEANRLEANARLNIIKNISNEKIIVILSTTSLFYYIVIILNNTNDEYEISEIYLPSSQNNYKLSFEELNSLSTEEIMISSEILINLLNNNNIKHKNIPKFELKLIEFVEIKDQIPTLSIDYSVKYELNYFQINKYFEEEHKFNFNIKTESLNTFLSSSKYTILSNNSKDLRNYIETLKLSNLAIK